MEIKKRADIKSRTKSRFLLARGICLYRLRLSDDALKELHKARSLIQQTSDRATFVKILRALATAYVEEGDAKRAGFALLHAMAVGGTSNYLEGQALILIEAGRYSC